MKLSVLKPEECKSVMEILESHLLESLLQWGAALPKLACGLELYL